MNNCLIMGSGRSGTSMVAGALSKSGYYMGENLIPARGANPKGFFESPQINHDVNEAILCRFNPAVRKGHWYVTPFGLEHEIQSTASVRALIRKLVAKEPYCYKDPRLCYTLPAWRAFLSNVKFICVFRHPNSTIKSIMQESQTAKYMQGANMTPTKAFEVWYSMYNHVLNRHIKLGEWFFVHYDQMFTSDTQVALSNFLGAKVDFSFPEESLRKIVPIFDYDPPKQCLEFYYKLCDLANYDLKRGCANDHLSN